MSRRSELRAEALERAAYACEWPQVCRLPGRLEMAHIMPSQLGGNPSRDRIENVWMLCKPMHDVYDARVSWKQQKPHIADLFDAFTEPGWLVLSCVWPQCDGRPVVDKTRGDLCEMHRDVLAAPFPLVGRTREIRMLAQAYIAARYGYGR